MATWSLAAHAKQSNKVPHVGVLVAESAPHPFPDAFRAGLQSLGYKEGQNIEIEWRYADGLYSRAIERATALVNLGVDVIAAHHTPAVKAAMTATSMIPIVMSPAGAPLQTGLVASLARPGGNVTGLSSMEAELGSKRLSLLRDVIAGLKSVAVLASRSDPFTHPYLADAQAAATQAGVTLQPVMVDGPKEFDAAFAAMSAANAQAVMIQPHSPHSMRRSCNLRQSIGLPSCRAIAIPRAQGVDLIFGRSCRLFSKGGDLRRQDSQGCQTRRSACGTANEIRTRRQPQGGEGSGLRRLSKLLARRRRGDRIETRHSRQWHETGMPARPMNVCS
jgi:putative tryptophan/tyrosine transport system substrate-binding protein